ncbi:MAG: glutathione S-transferase N-terminal domain-containing protein [Pseudomonadota bacterium]
MHTLYGDRQSGNCHKVVLILDLTDQEWQFQHVDIVKKETHTPEFLTINPNGKIPAIALSDGRILWSHSCLAKCETTGVLIAK